MKSFWQGVQNKNNKIKLSNIIDGKSKSSDIIGTFGEKFLKFEADETGREEISLIRELQDVWENERKFHPRVSVERLRELIKRLNIGEGHDKIHTLFLRNMSGKLLQLLSIFMNACYSHCYTPEELLNGDIKPTVKDSKGNVKKILKLQACNGVLKYIEII